jgi:dUTP pyrophosphatase
MLLSDREIKDYVSQGKLVQDMIDEKVQIQQAGVDLTAAKVFALEGEGIRDFTNEKRQLPRYEEIHPEGDSWLGIVEHTALWDPGYEGRSFLHVEVSRTVRIYKNARLAQMIFIRLAGEATPYSGVYKGEDILKFAKRGSHEHHKSQS